MSFPSSPTDGQTFTVNGITYSYVAAQGSWNRTAVTTVSAYTISSTPPSNPKAGDIWIRDTTGVEYVRLVEGSDSSWVEFSNQGQPGTAGATGPSGLVPVTAGPTGSFSQGQMRINTSTNTVEIYYNTSWYAMAYIIKGTATNATSVVSGSYTILIYTTSGTFMPYSTLAVDYLVVGGGAGGGWSRGGGGGAGGLLAGSTSLTAQTYTITVGAGGPGGTTTASTSQNGNGSSIGSSVTVSGGGYGASSNSGTGGAGGSGGGGAQSGAGGTATASQGFAGGTGTTVSGGGGGGASAVGGTGGASAGGTGGAGVANTLLTSTIATTYSVGQVSGGSVYFAGGGGGGVDTGSGSGTFAGGIGGGGAGGALTGSNVAGTAYTGGGGGGGGRNPGEFNGAAGGSGIVIIRYLT